MTLAALLRAAGLPSAEDDACKLIDKFGSLSYIMQSESFSLREYTGCSERALHVIRLAAELTSRRVTDRFRSGKKYTDEEIKLLVAGTFFASPIEQAYCLMFGANGKFISSEFLGDGTVNAASIMPRRVLDIMYRRGAKKMLLAHNHPCGAPIPSREDYVTTDLMSKVARNYGVEFIDHYIASGFRVCSVMATMNSKSDLEEQEVLKVGIDPIERR